MNSNIQLIKSQIENFKFQIDNIEMQNNNMMMNPGINLNNPIKISKKNCIFQNASKGNKLIVMDDSSTVEKLLNKYLDDVYYSREAKIFFLHDGRINRHEQKTIGDYFKYATNVVITVVEID